MPETVKVNDVYLEGVYQHTEFPNGENQFDAKKFLEEYVTAHTFVKRMTECQRNRRHGYSEAMRLGGARKILSYVNSLAAKETQGD